jgi:hypothetical protein
MMKKEVKAQKKKDSKNTLHWKHYMSIVVCISRPRNYSLGYREKNCRRGRLRPRQTISRMLKDFAGKVYTTFRKSIVVKAMFHFRVGTPPELKSTYYKLCGF